jgi:rhodanese-related sulfurtransferase
VDSQSAESKPVEVELISVEELKAKLAKGEPITIIDVRSANQYADSTHKIKGALHFKPRRLRSRMKFPPLKDLPREREVVTYCACPGEETSIRAAQTLMGGGFKRVRALRGGWAAWLKVNGPVEGRAR